MISCILSKVKTYFFFLTKLFRRGGKRIKFQGEKGIMSNGWLWKVCLGVFTLFRVTVIIKALACVQIVISKLSFVFWLKTKQNNDNQKTGLSEQWLIPHLEQDIYNVNLAMTNRKTMSKTTGVIVKWHKSKLIEGSMMKKIRTEQYY